MSKSKLLQKLASDNYTFPNTGAIPIITEARAERTCCEESDDNSCKSCSILECYIIQPKQKRAFIYMVKHPSEFLFQRWTPWHKEEYAELQDLDLKSGKTWSLSQRLLCVLQPHYLGAIEHRQGPTPLFTKNSFYTLKPQERERENIDRALELAKLYARKNQCWNMFWLYNIVVKIKIQHSELSSQAMIKYTVTNIWVKHNTW